MSSPTTRALTNVVKAHRWKGDAARAQSIADALVAFGLGSGPEEWRRADPELVEEMLTQAHVYDLRHGRYHWGVLVGKLLLEECVRLGLATPDEIVDAK